MRKLAFILLALNFMLTPMANSIAMALGFSGEHVHFDQAAHGFTEATEIAIAAHGHSHAHPHAHPHDDHEQNQATDDEPFKSAPLKHTHGEAHSAVFVLVATAEMIPPQFVSTAPSVRPSFPKPEHLYPPYRPPQTV